MTYCLLSCPCEPEPVLEVTQYYKRASSTVRRRGDGGPLRIPRCGIGKTLSPELLDFPYKSKLSLMTFLQG
ncbi:hypothetical protein SKAU_G00033970 [Synaphobranchus kaupii]|uniref:Uncharacterized protein n=1 Tax=Synaphobranchus kaupii TaxID=118154 RepID=A0A9Q1JGJ6_SYNKA|nr:hypothetical protein SKAU_G00033970 [Synaphobranchus kaupii]